MKIILNILIFILAWLVIESITSELEFQKVAKVRIAKNIQKLKDLRQVQIAYKKVNHTYANNFESLVDFIENGDIPIIKAIGETPDSLINGEQISDKQAYEMGLISRDTSYIDADSLVFKEIHREILARETTAKKKILELKGEDKLDAKAEYDQIKKEIKTLWKQFKLFTKQMQFIPHTEKKSYNINAGQVEEGKVLVQVFEISTTYGAVFSGLDAENRSYDLNSLLKVGSMDEASLNGNWGE